ncbi:hypothetical protein HaLaN_14415 [Haematococcus lacustris]|uniref:Uncharacterized protein n=1 Tax=Haematococcus lacustris TaxID=44745 RepID=A0A699Z588_HAELA|nr:hypothetical protein HaLaN_14415 [Haematococcus lacustris]
MPSDVGALLPSLQYSPHHDYFSFDGADNNGGNRYMREHVTCILPHAGCHALTQGLTTSAVARTLRLS